ncbi:hypothetical protein BDZ97DRAFT_1763752 [Flammula alnicola]|nr:hypothetical protein BDZ97DRAFT_1763752 [Flammula alnicola]
MGFDPSSCAPSERSHSMEPPDDPKDASSPGWVPWHTPEHKRKKCPRLKGYHHVTPQTMPTPNASTMAQSLAPWPPVRSRATRIALNPEEYVKKVKAACSAMRQKL